MLIVFSEKSLIKTLRSLAITLTDDNPGVKFNSNVLFASYVEVLNKYYRSTSGDQTIT